MTSVMLATSPELFVGGSIIAGLPYGLGSWVTHALEVMRGQIKHLLEMTERPNIRLQVLPFARGGHAAAGGPFTFLRFSEPALPDVVYIEQLTSALYLDKREDTDAYMEVMDRVSVQADSVSRTKWLLEQLRSYFS